MKLSLDPGPDDYDELLDDAGMHTQRNCICGVRYELVRHADGIGYSTITIHQAINPEESPE